MWRQCTWDLQGTGLSPYPFPMDSKAIFAADQLLQTKVVTHSLKVRTNRAGFVSPHFGKSWLQVIVLALHLSQRHSCKGALCLWMYWKGYCHGMWYLGLQRLGLVTYKALPVLPHVFLLFFLTLLLPLSLSLSLKHRVKSYQHGHIRLALQGSHQSAIRQLSNLTNSNTIALTSSGWAACWQPEPKAAAESQPRFCLLPLTAAIPRAWQPSMQGLKESCKQRL